MINCRMCKNMAILGTPEKLEILSRYLATSKSRRSLVGIRTFFLTSFVFLAGDGSGVDA